MSGSGWSAHFYTGHHTGKIKAAEKKNSTSFPMWNFFVPLRGLYFDFNIKANQHQFPPPDGNHTGDDAIVMGATIYPPPYGDYIDLTLRSIKREMFSPPYGDYISGCRKHSEVPKFSPPYGDQSQTSWYSRLRVLLSFIPLRGSCLKLL